MAPKGRRKSKKRKRLTSSLKEHRRDRKKTATAFGAVDLRDLYNLVFSPASAELHGEWTSLKKFNPVRCGNPLHRFHRLPQLLPPSILTPYAVLFAGTVLADKGLA